MEMLYILTHTCSDGGYTPVVFDSLSGAITFMLEQAKETLNCAFGVELIRGTYLRIEYGDDSFDEYRLFKVQRLFFLQTSEVNLSEEEYNLYGLKKFWDELSEFPNLIQNYCERVFL